ncbi:hypothetical protein D9M70_554540 [compost metagenome]
MTEYARLVMVVDSTSARKATDDLKQLDVQSGKTEQAAGSLASAFKPLAGVFASLGIANFVKEVNRGRVVHVEAVMTPVAADHAVNGATLSTGSTIEAALKILVHKDAKDLVVVDAVGMPVGVVDLKRLAAAVVTPH